MKKTRRLLSLLLVAALTLSLGAGALAADTDSGAYEGKIVFLHTNDTHGRIAYSKEDGVVGFDGIAALKDQYEAEGAYVLLFDAGDATQGKPVVNVYEGQNVIEFMNAAGYDAVTIGNHEFDFSFDDLLKMQDKAQFPMLAANLTYKSGGKAVLEENTVFTAPDGTKIGVFGLDTPETLTKASPVNTAKVSFGKDAADFYAIAKAQVKALEDEGCDLIVCLGHLGMDESSAPYRSTDLIENVPGIDLFVDGHSHTTLEAGSKVGDTLVVSTGEYFKNAGLVVYDPADGSFTASLLTAEDVAAPNAELTAAIEGYAAEVDAEYAEVFARTEVDLNGTRTGGDAVDDAGNVRASFPAGEGNRVSETNMGDYAADAILWQAQQIDETASAAITNGGGIRETIVKGDITKNDLITVYPFGNEVTLLKLTGAQILEALEAATWCTPTSIGAFPQVSGIEFSIDTRVPYTNGELYPDSTYYAPAAPGSRVTIKTIGGESYDADKVYTIATNNYSAAGGDTYYVFTQASYKYDTGVSLEDALISYTNEVLDGVIGEDYAEPQGRITVITDSLSQFSDLKADAWYADPVRYNLDKGYIKGMPGGLFAPDSNMTRIQYMTLLFRVGVELGYYEDAETTGENWAVPGAKLAEDLGFTWNTDAQNRDITRQEIAAASYLFLYDMLGGTHNLVIVREYVPFTDEADISAEYLDYVKDMYAADGIDGYTDGSFQPLGTARRCEIAQLVYNLLEVMQVAPIEAAA
ncbi:MAG: 5'-nucleotidase C-terminal domain-containing protein [Candidatus Heteroscillospira sp.]